jgi:hypothetical protein
MRQRVGPTKSPVNEFIVLLDLVADGARCVAGVAQFGALV